MRDPRLPYWCRECHAQHGVGEECPKELEVRQLPSVQRIPENMLIERHFDAPWLWKDTGMEIPSKQGHEGAVSA